MENEKITSAKVEKDGNMRYHENLVLDLDYTVLIPRHGGHGVGPA